MKMFKKVKWQNYIKTKSQNNRLTRCCVKTLFLIGNTVAHSSKQFFASVPHGCYSKSIKKFPRKDAHANALFLGQDGCLRKISSKVLWNRTISGTFR